MFRIDSRSAASVVLLLVLACVCRAQMVPVTVTGFNMDVVVENTAGLPPYSSVAAALNPSEDKTFYQAGLSNKSYGLPASGNFISAWGDGTVFQFAPCTGNNALLLNSATTLTAGSLVLPTPQIFDRLAVLAHSTSGGGSAPVTLTFSDGTALELTYNAPDWFNNSGSALSGMERIHLGSGATEGAPGNPRFYQTVLEVGAAMGSSNKPLARLTFQKTTGAATAIYAVSGELAPAMAPFFAAEPESLEVPENAPADFRVVAGGNPAPRLQWLRNHVAIPGATNSLYSLQRASITDQDANFRVIASNEIAGVSQSITSTPALLTVLPDTTKPVFTRVRCLGLQEVEMFFSEPVLVSAATNLANYGLTGPAGPVAVFNAVPGVLESNVVLRVSSLQEGSTYLVTVNGIRDIAAASNQIPPNSQLTFVASPWVPADIGLALPLGGTERVDGGVDVTGGGTEVGGTSDQFHFGYQRQTGDFDVRVRLAGLSLRDPWTEAGLMARETLDGGSRFAAALATPSISGCFFKSRSGINAAVLRAGSFPVNYPGTWLRLRRSADQFTGFASFDGLRWTQLGSVSLAMPASIYLGYAVCSHNVTEAATASFREFGNVTNGIAATPVVAREPLSQSSRRTPLVISEIMYHPPDVMVGDRKAELEFIEIFNTRGEPEDISGFRITGDIGYVFPANTILPGGGFAVVARSPADLQAIYGLENVLGPWAGAATNGLSNSAGTVRLRHRTGAVLLDVEYGSRAPWPVAADGAGHSLVLAAPSYGERNVQAWAASDAILGSPGQVDAITADPLDNVRINEFLAHTDDPEVDYIELYNRSTEPADISGCILTDDPSVNKFVVPPATVIPARGFAVFTQTTLGFALSAEGELIYLKNPAQTRVLDAVNFGGQENGVSTGRWPDGANDWYRLSQKTPGTNNAAIRPSQVVINELMYHPISNNDDDQFVELHNAGATPVNLSGWRLSEGISFQFPTNTWIGPGGFVVVGRSAIRLRMNYPQLNTTNCFGDFSGRLSGRGEQVALTMPDVVVSLRNNGQWETNTIHIAVDEVTYGSGGRWGQWSDGDGSSLELTDPRANRRLASSWADSDETGKAPWSLIEVQGVLDNGNVSADQLQVLLQGAGECLIDEVEVRDAQGTNVIANSGFESGAVGWVAQGTESQSGWEQTEGYGSSRSYRIRAVGRGDNQINRVRVGLTRNLSSGSVATIRARARWLKGNPELILRLRGNWLEAAGRMETPVNPGTPGLANSRRIANAPPGIYDVGHYPLVPGAGEAVTVTARVQDPDRFDLPRLFFRNDPSLSYASLPMRDDGVSGDAVAGDGVYTAVLPGAGAGATVAYYLQATDQATSAATARYPSDAPVRECLVRYGEVTPTGNLPVYRIWMTQATFDSWTARPKLDNTPNSVTFVLGNQRVIHGVNARFAGSPYIAPGFNTPSGNRCGYSIEFPKDDLFLNGTDLVLDWPGGHGNENTAIQEQMAYWIADRMDLPFSYRHHIRLHVNGVTDMQRGGVFEAILQPAREFLEQWSFEDSEGDFYKIDRAFEFDDSNNRVADPMPRLQPYVTPDLVNGGTRKKVERYRWTWLKRSYDSVLDYTNLFVLVDALNAADTSTYTSQTEGLADVRQWMGIFAFEHIINNFDSWGHDIGKNMYMFKPLSGRWQLYAFDLDWLMLVSMRNGYTASGGALFSSEDPTVSRMYAHPPFRRAYLQAVENAVNGPLLNTECDPVMDAKYASLVANGVTYCDGGVLANPSAVKTWIQQRRTALVAQLAQASAPFAVTGSMNRTVTSNLVTLSGTAPLAMASLRINGVDWSLTWTSVTNWTLQVPVTAGTTVLTIAGYDKEGDPLPGITQVNVTYSGNVQSPVNRVVINEILHNPPWPGAEYVELFNTSSNSFDLSGWRLRGLDYDFRPGAYIGANSCLVLTRDRVAFTSAFGIDRVPYDTFPGNLQRDGERISLVRPVAGGAEEIISRVRYSSIAPWPLTNNGPAALQLLDAGQDSWRVGNWSLVNPNLRAQPQWVFVSTNITASASTLYVYLGSAGEIYVDDLKLVRNGIDVVVNGGFEAPLAGTWTASADFVTSGLSTAVRRAGNSSLRLVATGPGAGAGDSLSQTVAVTVGQSYTLSFWYLQSTNGGPLVVRLSSSATPAVVDPAPPLQTNLARFTPGSTNSVAGTLAPFPQLWLNELQAENQTGITNSLGQRVPWLEIYNPTSTNISMAGLFLSTNSSRLDQWAFPAGAVVGPGQFKVVFADGQTNLSTATEWHTSFRLPALAGEVVLSRLSTNGWFQVLDFLPYAALTANRSYGSSPDGQSFDRQEFYYVTPGASNSAASPPLTVYINEWLADNVATLADPADGDFEDWIELHNPTDVAMDLSGFYMTDDLANRFQYQVPAGGQYKIPPHGFLLVWADGETSQNNTNRPDLHVNFRLAKEGESIGIFGADGTPIDYVTFGPQQSNSSEGRYPDSAPFRLPMPVPSPRAPNVLPLSYAPPNVVAFAVADGQVTFTFETAPGHSYRVEYSTSLNAPNWIPLTGELFATTREMTTTQSMDGVSQRFFRVLQVN